ncbi:hypothetical protein ACFX1X_014619 [Malus domestica]
MASPLASFNLSRKRADEEKMVVGFLTMEDFEGRDFNDDFHRSLSSIDRLCEVLCVRIRKNEREKQLKDGIAGKRIKPLSSTPTDVASSSCSNAAPCQLPGILPQGKYFNLGFDHKKQQKNEIRQPSFNFNWALQGNPKKPRSKSSFEQNPTTATATHDYVDLKSNIDSTLKRKYDGDEDWSVSKKKMKTKKRVYTKNNKASYLCPPPDLPEEYKKLIIGKMNGTELTLLIQKKLYPTDVNPNHNRLSLPPLQVLSGSFLTSNEIETLNQKSRDLGFLNIPFIDPRLKLKEKKGINLSLWTLSKSDRKSYALKTSWGKVVKKNKLVAGDVIQVWSFRANGNQLHLAIVLVQRATECSNQSGGSSHVFYGDYGIKWSGERSKGAECSTSASSDEVVDTYSDRSFVTQE